MSSPPKTCAPLSSRQLDIWIDRHLDNYPEKHNIGGYILIEGAFDESLIRQLLQQLIQRHDVLRVGVFQSEGKELPEQRLLEKVPLRLPIIDLRGAETSYKEAQAWMQQDMGRPFDLAEVPLWRFAILRLSDQRYFWYYAFHHLITDGNGHHLLASSLSELYDAHIAGKRASTAPNFFDLNLSDQSYSSSKRYIKDKAFWQQQFQTVPNALFIEKNAIPADTLTSGGTVTLDLEKSQVSALNHAISGVGAERMHAILALLYLYFSRTFNQDDLAIGVALHGRRSATEKKILGLFSHSIPLRLDMGLDRSLAETLIAIRERLASCYRHSRFPLRELNRLTEIHKTASHRLFDVQLSFVPNDYGERMMGKAANPFHYVSNLGEQSPLAIYCLDDVRNGVLRFHFNYNFRYISSEQAQQMVRCFSYLIEQACVETPLSLKQYSLVTDAEAAQIQLWSRGGQEPSSETTVLELFDQQVTLRPHAVALRHGDARLSYIQLNQQANQLAHRLIEFGVQLETLVGLYVDRSFEMIIGLLAILKAGAAYVPMDQSYPADRIAYLLEDSGVRLMLCHPHLMNKIPKIECLRLLDINQQLTHSWDNVGNPQVQSQVNYRHLAYLNYTSGSTGHPKGVAIEHQGITGLVSEPNYMRLDSNTCMLQTASIGFDGATLELWGVLANGGQLILPTSTRVDVQTLAKDLERYPINTLWLTTGLFHQMVDLHLSSLDKIAYLLTGGELLSPLHAKKILEHLPDCALINCYGPTENTTFTSCYRIEEQDFLQIIPDIPIGKPNNHRLAYVLDSKGQPLPQGVAGELYLGGTGLARGYINRSELTNAYGQLEFMGRLDDQIKLRGYRIEPGEIEATLCQQELVDAAFVMAAGEKEQRQLYAYVTVKSGLGEPIDTKRYQEDLNVSLRKQLPRYMVPSAVMILACFPLTTNGKIDRKKLPKPIGYLGVAIVSRSNWCQR